MNIQTYILPEWESMLEHQEIETEIHSKFSTIGASMAEYLDRFMMRSIPTNWFLGWTKFHFPLRTNVTVIDLHKVIGTHFEEFIEKYRAGRKEEFSIASGQINRIKLLEQRYLKLQQEKADGVTDLRNDLKSTRKKSERKDRKPAKEKVVTKVDATLEEESEQQSPGIDHDTIYKQWMTMVESKPISKSYWHIHEYMCRYILEFATKNSDDGIVTKDIIDDFLAEYGKGKRPKTMNHYNRVVYRFWEFYDNLIKEDGNEMAVW